MMFSINRDETKLKMTKGKLDLQTPTHISLASHRCHFLSQHQRKLLKGWKDD